MPETEGSQLHSQKLANDPYPKQGDPIHTPNQSPQGPFWSHSPI
jgi:hypothetical protein